MINFISTSFNEDGSDVLGCTVKWGLTLVNDKPQQFNLDLALSCCALCCASYDENAVASALKRFGFSKITTSGYKAYTDVCAAAFGYQKTKQTELAVCVIRGTAAGQWQSNFELGSGEYHNGFEHSSACIEQQLLRYLKSVKADKRRCKILICGHSKGGACANIIGARLAVSFGSDRIYCYTFACPNTARKEKLSGSFYGGIFNLVNSLDFIPFVPLEGWGFGKFGTTIDLLSDGAKKDNTDLAEKTKSAFFKLTKGGNLEIFDTFEISSKEFLQSVYSIAKTDDDYYTKRFRINDADYSLFDYFSVLCQVLEAGGTDFEHILFFMSTLCTELAPLSQFLMQNSEKGIAHSPLMTAHACETYFSVLSAYGDK